MVQRVVDIVFGLRLPSIAASLVAVIYFTLFAWTSVPRLPIDVYWFQDVELRVGGVDGNRQPAGLRGQERILFVDDQPISRSVPVFRLPLRDSYEIGLIRDGEFVTQTLTARLPSPNDDGMLVAFSVAAWIGWLVGALILQYGHRDRNDVVAVGGTFLLGAIACASFVPLLNNAPLSWVGGHALLPLLALAVANLGQFGQQKSRSAWSRRTWFVAGTVAVFLAAAGAWDALVLWPQGRSLGTLIGYSFQSVGVLSVSVSLIIALVTLGLRVWRLPSGTNERSQLAILLTFVGLGAVPFALANILPEVTTAFNPVMLGVSFLLFIPAGFLFIFFRQGYLWLDALAARLITLAILAIAGVLIYIAGTTFIERVTLIGSTPAFLRGTILVGIAIAVGYAQRPLRTVVDTIIYGPFRLPPDAISTAAAQIAARPEQATVRLIVAAATARLGIAESQLLVRRNGLLTAVHPRLPTGQNPAVPLDLSSDTTLRRGQNPHAFAQCPDWADLLIPLRAGDEAIGVWMLGRPGDGQYNLDQVRSLGELASVLATGLQVVNLVEESQRLSSRLLYVRDRERHELATALHNEPLQALGALTNQLTGNVSADTAAQASQTLREVTQQLRRICAGLHPPELDKSMEWMTREVVRSFEEEQPQLNVRLALNLTCEQRPTEQVVRAYYNILVEALNNVAKHAHASATRISVEYTPSHLILRVEDDGIGIAEQDLTASEMLRRRHFGMTGMQRWADLVGGTLAVTRRNPAGTRVSFVCAGPRDARDVTWK